MCLSQGQVTSRLIEIPQTLFTSNSVLLLMFKKGETKRNCIIWSSAKYFYYSTWFFVLSIGCIIISIGSFFSPLLLESVNLWQALIWGLAPLIMAIIFLYLLFKNDKLINWIYCKYLTYHFWKEVNIISGIISNFCNTNSLKIINAPFKFRFPIEIVKSYVIDNKIQIDIGRFYYGHWPDSGPGNWIVIFLGPINENNNSLSEKIKNELDKKFDNQAIK